MKPVMHIGFDFVVRNLPPPTIGYDFDSKCTVSHSPATGATEFLEVTSAQIYFILHPALVGA